MFGQFDVSLRHLLLKYASGAEKNGTVNVNTFHVPFSILYSKFRTFKTSMIPSKILDRDWL